MGVPYNLARSLYIWCVGYSLVGVYGLDKECELQKIEAFGSYLQTSVNALYSFLAGGLIGILILLLTLFIEGIFDVFGGRFLGLIPFSVVLVCVFYANYRILLSINGRQTKFNALVFDLISRVERGEPIPPLAELEKMVYFSSKFYKNKL